MRIRSQEIQLWRAASFSQSQKLQFACNRSQELQFGMEPFQLKLGAQAATCCRDDLHPWQALLAAVRLCNQQIPPPPAAAPSFLQSQGIQLLAATRWCFHFQLSPGTQRAACCSWGKELSSLSG